MSQCKGSFQMSLVCCELVWTSQVSVCLSVPRTKRTVCRRTFHLHTYSPTHKTYRLQAHISPTQMLHARLIKRTNNFRLKTGPRTNSARQPSPFCKTELHPVSCPQRPVTVLATANLMREIDATAFVSIMQAGIAAYEWTRDERSELRRKSQFCAWCVDVAANRSVYISVDARICRIADDEDEITRKVDLHDLLTHILRTHSPAL